MILTIKQKQRINEILNGLLAQNPDIEWVTEDECLQYKNSEYASLLIGLGSGKHTKHLQDSEMWNAIELGNYYGEQCKLYIIVDTMGENIKIRVYKSNGNGLNNSSLISEEII